MMRFPRHSLAALLVLLALPALAFGQTTPGAPAGAPTMEVPSTAGVLKQGEIKLETSIDKEIIRVGDLVHYSLAITAPDGSKVMMPPPGSELGRFLIRDYHFPEDQEQAPAVSWINRLFKRFTKVAGPAGDVTHRFDFTITTYLTGDLPIPPLPVVVIDPQGAKHTLLAESSRIRVVPVTDPQDLTIRDIAAPVAVPFRLTAYWKYLLPIPLGLIVIAIIVWLLIRRRRRRAEEPIELRPAHEIALEELLELEGMNLLQAGEYERFYTRLSYILRKYLALRYTIYALEFTTAEILEIIKRLDLGLADYEAVRKFLDEADQVKFARLTPELEARKSAIGRVREIVEHTRERLPEPELEAA